MSNNRNYKYKLELAEDVDVFRKMPGSDISRQNMYVDRKGRRGIFKPTLNLRLKKLDVAVDKKTCSEYGEKLAHEICNIVGIPSCDVDILKLNMVNPRSKSRIPKQVPGIISYIDLKPGEDLVIASSILSSYKSDHPEDYNNIELIIPAFMSKVKESGGSDELAEKIKQQIIDMCVFDCRFANRDRNDENYGLAIMKDSVRFYPLFDNEYILGLSEPTTSIQKHSAASLQEHISKDLYSVIGVTSTPTKISSASLMTYLFTTYPEETKKAYDKIMQFKVEDLEKLLDEFEGLPEEHKAYALIIFRLRSQELEGIKREYIDKNGKIIVQEHLPGNKPMEMVNGVSGSKSNSKRKKSLEEI